MEFLISTATVRKLKDKHKVTVQEVIECFGNNKKKDLIDRRRKHRTEPPTRWFISKTERGRQLKVVFITTAADQTAIKTAYEPNENEKRLYDSEARGEL